LIIHGSKQIGKTYSIDEFGRANYKNYLRIDFSTNPDAKGLFAGDISADRLIRSLQIFYPDFKVERGDSLLFLDEIQLCDDARCALKPLVVDGRLNVVASGSLLGVMGLKRSENEGIFGRRDDWTGKEASGGCHVSPLGYERLVRMYPMDFEEYFWANGISEEAVSEIRDCISKREPLQEPILYRLNELYRQYLIVGGMPNAVKNAIAGRYDEVLTEQKALLEGYRTDVLTYAPRNLRIRIADCIESIPRQMKRGSRKFSYSEMSSGGNEGWREYAEPLTWLDAAGYITCVNGLTEPVRPLDMSIGRYFKLFFCDTGLLMPYLDDADRLALYSGDASINEGAMAEASVATMLERSGVGTYFFERDRNEERKVDRIEIDFVTSIGTDLMAIEVKSGKKRRCPSLNKLMTSPSYSIYRFTRFVMLGNTNIFVDDKGVEHYPLFAAAFADSMSEPVVIGLKNHRRGLEGLAPLGITSSSSGR